MNSKEKGQAFVEMALMLPLLVTLITAMVAFGMVIHDAAAAANSAQAATHAAAIHIADGSGATCYDRAMQALGDPAWIMVESATFTIDPCSATDPYWVGTPNTQVVGTWEFEVNPPLPFLYSNGIFPLDVSIPFYSTFR